MDAWRRRIRIKSDEYQNCNDHDDSYALGVGGFPQHHGLSLSLSLSQGLLFVTMDYERDHMLPLFLQCFFFSLQCFSWFTENGTLVSMSVGNGTWNNMKLKLIPLPNSYRKFFDNPSHHIRWKNINKFQSMVRSNDRRTYVPESYKERYKVRNRSWVNSYVDILIKTFRAHCIHRKSLNIMAPWKMQSIYGAASGRDSIPYVSCGFWGPSNQTIGA